MMGLPALADALEDFAGRRDGPVEFGGFSLGEPAGLHSGGPALPGIDPDELVRDAVERAEAELTTRLTEAHEIALKAERESHAAEIEALNADFAELLGSRLTGEMAAAEEAVTSLVTAVTARILGPVLTRNLQVRMVDSLAAAIREAMNDAENIRVRISGSPSLYEALCAAVGEKAAFLDFTESASADLTVRVEDNLIETRLSEWSAALEEAL